MDYPISGPLDEQELSNFLWSTAIPLQLATLDQYNHPIIHPVWFHFEQNKLSLTTPQNARKIENIKHQATVYFSINHQERPYKGVRGKATAKIINDIELSIELTREMLKKYLGSLDSPQAQSSLRNATRSLVIELTPHYMITWDYGREQ